jgi:hypothetical protein
LVKARLADKEPDERREVTMRRKQLLILLGVVALLIGGAVYAVLSNDRFQKWRRPPTVDLPSEDDVFEMRASLLESEVGFPRTPEFVVPASHVPAILRWLRPGEYVPHPPILPHNELGEIWIKTNAGRELHLRFYDAGVNPVVYTLDGTDHFWGNAEDERGRYDGGIGLGKAVRAASEATR